MSFSNGADPMRTFATAFAFAVSLLGVSPSTATPLPFRYAEATFSFEASLTLIAGGSSAVAFGDALNRNDGGSSFGAGTTDQASVYQSFNYTAWVQATGDYEVETALVRVRGILDLRNLSTEVQRLTFAIAYAADYSEITGQHGAAWTEYSYRVRDDRGRNFLFTEESIHVPVAFSTSGGGLFEIELQPGERYRIRTIHNSVTRALVPIPASGVMLAGALALLLGGMHLRRQRLPPQS
jgi:hypothetical protein